MSRHQIDISKLNAIPESWIARKVRDKLVEHTAKYPTFRYGNEYIDWILSLEPKSRAWAAYQPISDWSKQRRKTDSFSRFAASQN